MRNLTKLLLTAGLAVAFVSFTLAQQQGQRGGGGFGRISEKSVLMSKEIQAELKVTDAQKEKLAKLSEKFAAEMKELFGGGKKGFDRDAIAKLGESDTKATEEFVKAEFKPEQAKRFKQLYFQAVLQFGGPDVFTRDDVQTELKFSDKQKEMAKTTIADTRKDTSELFQSVGKDKDKRTEMMEKVAKLNKEATDKITGSFSADQKKTWEEMLGSKVEMKREWFIGARPDGGNFKKKKQQN